MKSFTFLLLSVLLSFGVMAKKDDAIHIKSLDLNLQRVPGGLYMSQEITNGQYLAFLNDLIKQGRAEDALKYTPDTLSWRSALTYGNPLVEYYFRHPAYHNFPVVGIDVAQANAFCAWLTKQVKADPKLNLPNALCILPSENEWISASAPFLDNPYPWYGPYAYDEKGDMLCNVKVERIDENAFLKNEGIGSIWLTAQIESYYPNKFGLYNIIGKVAELTSEGYIKGGSWDNTIDECAITKRQEFELPSPYVGFRVLLRPKVGNTCPTYE